MREKSLEANKMFAERTQIVQSFFLTFSISDHSTLHLIRSRPDPGGSSDEI